MWHDFAAEEAVRVLVHSVTAHAMLVVFVGRMGFCADVAVCVPVGSCAVRYEAVLVVVAGKKRAFAHSAVFVGVGAGASKQ
jgi:hypothetical protein